MSQDAPNESRKCINRHPISFTITQDLSGDLVGEQEAGVCILKLLSASSVATKSF